MNDKKYDLSKIKIDTMIISMNRSMSIETFVKGKQTPKEHIALNTLFFLLQLKDDEFNEALSSLDYVRDKILQLMDG